MRGEKYAHIKPGLHDMCRPFFHALTWSFITPRGGILHSRKGENDGDSKP